ncbi:MAG: DUF4869 domain-containing protein [Oribacterium sp.]|nr:DUF4869 domain-containing protein [Oribacterium sp.]
MLSIYYGDMPEAIYDTATYFRNVYKPSWITSPLAVEMIKDVDKSKVVSGSVIESPYLGSITPNDLSGGVKTLILIDKDRNHIFNASTCGDNCAQWILKMAEKRKVVINLRHLMDFGKGPFNIYVMNTGKKVHTSLELLNEAGNLV